MDIESLEKVIRGQKIAQEMEKHSTAVLEKEFEEVNKHLPEDEPLDIEELARLTDEVYFQPSRNANIIELMRQCHPNKSKKKLQTLTMNKTRQSFNNQLPIKEHQFG